MSKWKKVKFDEAIWDDSKNGNKIKKEDYAETGKYIIIDQGQKEIAGFSDKVNAYDNLPAIIFGDHTCAIKYANQPFFMGADGVKILKLKQDNLDYKFLYYYLIKNKVRNTGYNRHFKYLKELMIVIPPSNVQKKVVEQLDMITQLLELRKKQLIELDNLVKSRFVEMFGDLSTNSMGWVEGTIRDIVKEVKYGTSKPAIECGKYKYIRMNNITYSGELDLTNLKFIDISEKEVEKCLVRKGDLLFNRTNSKELVGKTCIFNLDEEMIVAGYIIRVRMNEKALPEYLSSVLNSKYGKETLYGMCKSIVGQANINAQELQNIKILIPPIELQYSFVWLKEKVDNLKVEVRKSLDETQTLMDSLMQKYFE